MAAEEEVLGKAYDSRLMRRLLVYLRPYWWQVAISLTAIVFRAMADIAGPVLVMFEVDQYLSPVAGGSHSFLIKVLSPDPLIGISQIAALYVGIIAFGFLLDYLQTYFMQWTGQMVMFDLRSQIFRHLQRMHIGFYDKNPVGRLVTRVTTDVDALNEMFTAGVVSIFEDIFVLAGIIGIMLCFNWKLALITFAALPLIGFATKLFRDRVRDSYRRIRVAIARINSYLQEHVSGMMVLQLFNREERAFEEFSRVNAVHMDAFKDAILAHAVYYPIVEIISSAAIASVIWFGGLDVLHTWTVKSLSLEFTRSNLISLHVISRVTTLGLLFAFMQYAQRFFRPIQDLSEKYNILQSAMASSERIFKLLDTPPEIVSPGRPKQPEGQGRVEFDHVWFAYRTLAQAAEEAARKGEKLKIPVAATASLEDEYDWILRDVSFTIEPGETVAIVGHTGAGKTTIISLLMRFYDVQKGAIKIDGVNIKDIDLDELRRRYGVVLQDPFLFTGTVETNIRLGTQQIADEDVEKAAEDVNLADFIRSLPGGFQEKVHERGSTLSTGQK